MCSGCATSCATTSPPRWRRSRTWTPPTPWNCWPARPTRPSAARLTTAQISAALKRARRRDIEQKTTAIRAALRASSWPSRRRSPPRAAAVVRALAAVITTLSEQIKVMEGQVPAHFQSAPGR